MLTQAAKRKTPILMYHSISEHATPSFKPYTLTPIQFTEHMEYLRCKQYSPLSVTQFIKASNDNTLPERPIILTFDDAFADFFTHALPILQEYHFTATLYIPTAFVDGTSRWLEKEGEGNRTMLSWEQIMEISSCDIECGAHTHHHLPLDTLSSMRAQEEIMLCKYILENRIGKKVETFAYPYGFYTTAVRKMVQAAGYASACAVKHAMNSESYDPFALMRYVITASTTVDDLHALLYPSIVRKINTPLRIVAWHIARNCSNAVIRSNAFLNS